MARLVDAGSCCGESSHSHLIALKALYCMYGHEHKDHLPPSRTILPTGAAKSVLAD